MKQLIIFMILLNHMFQLGSADQNGHPINDDDEKIKLKINTLKQMANSLKQQQNNIAGIEYGQFNKPNSRNIDELNALLIRITNIEHSIGALADKNGYGSETMKVRVNDLENEVENLRKLLDTIFRENKQYQSKLEDSLTNVTSAYKDMAKRLLILEEPGRLKELEGDLLKRDYLKAKQNADLIVHDDKIIDVLKNAYLQQKDIDGYLYFAGIVNKLSSRLLIYRYIYNDIIIKQKFQHNDIYFPDHSYFSRYKFLSTCYSLKLLNKLENSVMKMASVSADVYSSADRLKTVCKSNIDRFLQNLLINGKFKRGYESNGIKSFVNKTIVNDTAAMVTVYENSTIVHDNIMQAGLYLDYINEEFSDCVINTKFLLYNRDIITRLMFTSQLKDIYIKYENRLSNDNDYRLSNNGKEFLSSLKENNYIRAAEIFNTLKSNESDLIVTFKGYCYEFDDVDSILKVAELLTPDYGIAVYYGLLYFMNITDPVNICNMLKLQYSFYSLNGKHKMTSFLIKARISYIIIEDIVVSMSFLSEELGSYYFYLFAIDFNEIGIYTRNDNKIIGKYRYYLVKENGKLNCYFDGKLSLNNFDNWYWKVLPMLDWVLFVGLVTKLCQANRS